MEGFFYLKDYITFPMFFSLAQTQENIITPVYVKNKVGAEPAARTR